MFFQNAPHWKKQGNKCVCFMQLTIISRFVSPITIKKRGKDENIKDENQNYPILRSMGEISET